MAPTPPPAQPNNIVIWEQCFCAVLSTKFSCLFLYKYAPVTYGHGFCFRHAQTNRKYRSSILKYKYHPFGSWMSYIQPHAKVKVNGPLFSRPFMFISSGHGASTLLVELKTSRYLIASLGMDWEDYVPQMILPYELKLLGLCDAFDGLSQMSPNGVMLGPVLMLITPWMWQWSGCKVYWANQLIWQPRLKTSCLAMG